VAISAEREALTAAAARVRWWPAALAFFLLGVLYALLSEQLTLGPPWVVLVLAALTVVGARVSRWRGLMRAYRWIGLAGLGLVSVAVTVSAGYLVGVLPSRGTAASDLLRDAAVLWVSNVLTFSLLYWEVDGGGPANRHATRCGSSDFAFPQQVVDGDAAVDWLPDYLDYLFLAFNTSTAFSPTDTMVLARRAKVLMMWQSLVSLITIAVLAARAINTI
jgi:hypothetical protein